MEVLDTDARQDGERDARPDVRHLDQLAEERALPLASESVQDVRVLAHDEVRVQRRLGADGRQSVEGRHGRLELVPHATDLDYEQRRMLRGHPPAQEADQARRPRWVAATSECCDWRE